MITTILFSAALFSAAALLTLVAILMYEIPLRRNDPRPQFDKVVSAIADWEPDTADVLRHLYDTASPNNRRGHLYLLLADTHLQALRETRTRPIHKGEGGEAAYV